MVGAALVEPQYERPPEGLGRGRWPAPPWVIALLGLAALLVAGGYLFARARRELRRRRGSDAPRSSRRPGPR